jgi:hypothetical protein
MKKTMMLALCVWLLASGKAAADNTLSVANVTIPKGGQATMEIVGDFSTTFVGGQWDLELPVDGKVTPTMSDGKPVATFGFTGTDHSISSSQLKNSQEELLPKYRFIFTSMSSSALPSSGVLMRIVLNASEDAEVGTVYNVKLSGIELGTANSDKSNIGDVAFTITIGDALPMVTLDETSTTAPSASSGLVDVTVNRTIKAGEWSTICLPFDMSEDQVKAAFGNDVQLAEMSSWSFEGTTPNVDHIKIGFTNVTAIENHHPYIIKVSSNVTSFKAYNVSITTNAYPYISKTYSITSTGFPPVQTNYNAFMLGNYAASTVGAKYIFLSGNNFWYSNGQTNIKGFRATFVMYDSNNNLIALNSYNTNSSRITMSFNDGVTTGIDDATHLVKNVTNNCEVYNLNGQRIDHPKKGLFIQDGKKVFIK